ncbi:MAG: 2-amino-4-hydroxy-6-hydroxymethyldihydropteridine diphosphokinase, partial [Chlamydiia bacterium]|nr:2-amino-4-hydroxy-6-hydroxymethyldihydropteridine diphosphokinase [Chlamydiia bacterium]
NAVVAFSTSLAPQELFQLTSRIEKKLGKFSKPKTHPRTIDLDILFYGREQISSDLLQIPHPRWSERLFVVDPLMQLTPSVHVRTSDGQMINCDLRAIRQTLTQTKPTEFRGEIACPLKQSPLRISA